MATKNFKVIYHIENNASANVTDDDTSHSPVAIRDVDEELTWIEGSYIGNGDWEFNIPSGISCGWKFGVETADGVFTEDAYLSGTISGNNLGTHLSPIETIEDA